MNFDRLAPHYDWMEALTAGTKLQRARTHWLDALTGRRNVLSVGEGHGRFAAALLERFPDARLTCVEASPAMLAVAQRRTHPWRDRVTWIGGDALDWHGPEQYDAIVTCFFLDCFPAPDLARLVSRLSAAAAPDAVWLVADFSLPAGGLARVRARAIHTLMYTFFRMAVALPARRLTPPDRLLEAQGFKREGRREAEWGLLRSDLWRRRKVDAGKAEN